MWLFFFFFFPGFSMYFQFYISVLQDKVHTCILSMWSLENNIQSHLLKQSPVVQSIKKVFCFLSFNSDFSPFYEIFWLWVQGTEKIHHKIKWGATIESKGWVLKLSWNFFLCFYWYPKTTYLFSYKNYCCIHA